MFASAVQAVVLGLLVGAVYGLFSVGLSLSFGVMRVVNFAYGDFVMLGMFAAYEISEHTGYSVYASLPVIAVGGFGFGWIAYFVFFRGTEAPERHHDQLLVALGVSILLEATAVDLFGSEPKSLAGGESSLKLGDLSLPTSQLIAFLIALALTVAVEIVLLRTNIGRALRATVADRSMATMLGVRSSRLFPMAFAVSIALAGIAGVILLSYLPVTSNVGQTFILLAFICVVLGGAGDTRGAFVAGLIVGVLESLTQTFWRPELQDTVVYIVFIVVIMTRPKGLFGRANV